MDQLPSFEETQPLKTEVPTNPEPANVSAISKTDELPSFEHTVETDSEKYGTMGQKLLTTAEGLGQGFAGPVATAAELGLHKLGVPGISPEEIEARKQANPILSESSKIAGLGAGLMTGVGELGLLAKAGEAVTGLGSAAKAAPLAVKVGANAVKAFTEMYGLQLGDEASKWMLGQGDPEAPVATALANSGYAGLIAAGISTALTGVAGPLASTTLKAIADTKMGQRAGQFLEDFGNRWKFHQENPNIVQSVHDELSNFYDSTNKMVKGVFGDEGIKYKAIQKLMPEMSDKMVQHAIDINDMAAAARTDLVKAGTSRANLNEFGLTMSRYNEAINQAKTPIEFFKAADNLKKELGEYVPWAKYKSGAIERTDPARNMIFKAADMYKKVQQSLESADIWGKSGDLQRGINKLTADFIPANDAFKTFTMKPLNERMINPQKIKTYVNNVGKTGAEVLEEERPIKMKNYIDAAEKYRDGINDMYAQYGIESPVTPVSLNATKSTYGASSKGAETADDLFHGGVSKIVGKVAGGLGGFAAGHATHLGYGAESVSAGIGQYIGDKLSPTIEKVIGRPIKKHVIPAFLKVLSEGSPKSVAYAIDHASNIARGQSAIQTGVNSIFTGSKIAGKEFFHEHSDKATEKIKKYIEHGGVDTEIQEQLNKQNQQMPPVQGFAEGGEVKKQEIAVPNDKAMDVSDHLGTVYPEQNILMNTAKARVYNYLNSVRPIEAARLPFDNEHKNPSIEKAYNEAVGIANKPLSLLPHIQKGTLTPAQVKHMTSMWPEVHSQLSKKILERMTEAQIKKEKPPFHIRQSLSMFLGQPLDSSLTPQSIQAAQAVFVNQKIRAQQAALSTAKTGKMDKISKQYQTNSQAAEAREKS